MKKFLIGINETKAIDGHVKNWNECLNVANSNIGSIININERLMLLNGDIGVLSKFEGVQDKLKVKMLKSREELLTNVRAVMSKLMEILKEMEMISSSLILRRNSQTMSTLDETKVTEDYKTSILDRIENIYKIYRLKDKEFSFRLDLLDKIDLDKMLKFEIEWLNISSITASSE